jgi:hypothetical protein
VSLCADSVVCVEPFLPAPLIRPVAALVMAASLVPAVAAAPPVPAAPVAPAGASTATATGAAPAAGPAGQAASPLYRTRSYYIANPGLDSIRNLGCQNGDTAGRATLFFGAPTVVRGAYGTTLWGGADRTVTEIGELVQDYVRGYVWCRRSPALQLFVGMGTSTSAIDTHPSDWVWGHGRTWAATVRAVADWAAAYYPGAVRIYGAWDAEPSWSTYERADRWMQGYDSEPGRRALHANFSADGCPRDSTANGPCNNGWRQESVWQLAWRYDPSLPMPQIYATSGVNARQWQQIDLYGTIAHGDGMVFWGTLSQHAACGQVGGCRGTDNTPQQAHDHLLWQLNTHPATAQPTIETATDMHWHR